MGLRFSAVAILLVLAVAALPAQDSGTTESQPTTSRRASRSILRESGWFKWDVAGVTREAWIHFPWKERSGPSPVVFGFHGHGGSARNASRSFRLEEHWPEAMVVYMQGLPTPIRRLDPEGRLAGWQTYPGDQNDRDFKFFDAVLASLKSAYKVDEDRVYATGHSNGGTFTYLLWAKRSDVFAAFAPSAAGSWSVLTLPPKPAMHVAGVKDTLVEFENQQRTMMVVRARNGCAGPPQEWAPGCRLYPSTRGAPFVSFIHAGDHKYPDDAPALIVRFFREHVRPAAQGPGTRR